LEKNPTPLRDEKGWTAPTPKWVGRAKGRKAKKGDGVGLRGEKGKGVRGEPHSALLVKKSEAAMAFR